jgi:Fe-S-cluster containining protein
MNFSQQIIRDLLHASSPQCKELEKVYALLPKTQCQRRALCCSVLPEMSLVEALVAINQLINKDPSTRRQLIKKIVSYFFLNPVEITMCPFLDGRDCLIYQHRYFGCRAYGLWSKEYYEKLAESSRQVKKHIQRQWEYLGIFLPKSVIDFKVPYCLNVTIDGYALINDNMLLNVSENIETLSKHFFQWHYSFRQQYFSDLSFLLTSLVFGVRETVQMKFIIVSDIVTKGDRSRLDRIVNEFPDFGADLI